MIKGPSKADAVLESWLLGTSEKTSSSPSSSSHDSSMFPERPREKKFFYAENEAKAKQASMGVPVSNSTPDAGAGAQGQVTAPYVEADVERMPPPPSVKSMAITSGTGGGGNQKGQVSKPAPAGVSARDLARNLAKAIMGTKKTAPKPAEGDPEAKAPSATPPKSGFDDATKIAATLKMAGAPAAFVGANSVLWAAVVEKIASVRAAAGDDEDAERIAGDQAHPLALFTQLDGAYPGQWRSWDLETIEQTLAADYGRAPSSSTMNKIAACKLVGTSDQATVRSDWHVFEKVALAFNGVAPRLTLVEDLSPEQMAFAVSCLRTFAGMADVGPVVPFSSDMVAYCAARLHDAGMVLAPPELGFCDARLAELAGPQNAELRKEAKSMYASALQGTEPSIDQDNPPAEFVQAARLMRIHAYVLDKIDDLVRQAL